MQDLHFQFLCAFISLGQGHQLISFGYPSVLASLVSSAHLYVKELFTEPEEEQPTSTAQP